MAYAVHQGVFLFQLVVQQILHGDKAPEFLENRSRRAAVQGGQPQIARQSFPKGGEHGHVEQLLQKPGEEDEDHHAKKHVGKLRAGFAFQQNAQRHGRRYAENQADDHAGNACGRYGVHIVFSFPL